MNAEAIALYLTLGVMVVGAIAFWAIRVSQGEAAAKEAARLRVDLGIVERDLAAFKEHVAREYMTNNAMLQVEQRLTDAINRLGDRLDRAFTPTRTRTPAK